MIVDMKSHLFSVCSLMHVDILPTSTQPHYGKKEKTMFSRHSLSIHVLCVSTIHRFSNNDRIAIDTSSFLSIFSVEIKLVLRSIIIIFMGVTIMET